MSYQSEEYEIEKIGHNKYKVTPVNPDGCGCLAVPLLILGVFFAFGGKEDIIEFFEKPVIAIPLIYIAVSVIFVFIVVIINSIVRFFKK